MILPSFTYLEPRSLDEACSLLARHNGNARILAGGTDILVDLKQRIYPDTQRLQPVEYLVSLCRVPGLNGITVHNGSIVIGSMTTMTAVAEHPAVAAHLEALKEGASEVGSPLVRNRGTLGGNLANARPAADTAGPVIALGGRIIVRGPEGDREIPSADFFTGPGRNVLNPGEVLRAIYFDIPGGRKGSAYVKLAVRKALDISIVGVSASLVLRDDGAVQHAAVCLTSAGPVPILSAGAAAVLIGMQPTDDVLRTAAEAAAKDARPIDDARGSAWYRRAMAEVLTVRMLRISRDRALKEAKP